MCTRRDELALRRRAPLLLRWYTAASEATADVPGLLLRSRSLGGDDRGDVGGGDGDGDVP